jgi:tetratricopeptide (TPR) repeat protein
LSLSSLDAAQESTAEFTVEDYANLVQAYAAGETLSSARQLAYLPEDQVRNAAETYSGQSLLDMQIKTAAMLHTEILLQTGIDQPFHYQMARAWIREITSQSDSSFEHLWYLTLSYHYMRTMSGVARFALESAANAFPDDPEIRLALATFYETSGWMQKNRKVINKAESHYRMILEIEPDSTEAMVRLGRTLALTGQESEALAMLKQGLERTDVPWLEMAVHMTLGYIHRKEGNFPEAIQSYRTALAMDSTCQSAAVALAHTVHQAGDRHGSLDIIQEFFRNAEITRPRATGLMVEEHDLWWRYVLGNSNRYGSLLDRLREEAGQ